MSNDLAAVIIALLALVFSVTQWIGSRRSERLRLLLGEKETMGFEAMRIANGTRFVSKDVVHALLLTTLLESSDRARLQIYRALDVMRHRHEAEIVRVRAQLVLAADLYEAGLDRGTFDKRLGQLDAALPWVAPRPL
jgi:hypothetical protein